MAQATTNERATAEAVNEATRIAAEAARRGADTARATVEAARTYLDETSELGEKWLAGLAGDTETALRASFDVQNAAIDATIELVDVVARANKQAVVQWAEIVRRAQRATLETWQAGVRAAERFAAERPSSS